MKVEDVGSRFAGHPLKFQLNSERVGTSSSAEGPPCRPGSRRRGPTGRCLDKNLRDPSRVHSLRVQLKLQWEPVVLETGWSGFRRGPGSGWGLDGRGRGETTRTRGVVGGSSTYVYSSWNLQLPRPVQSDNLSRPGPSCRGTPRVPAPPKSSGDPSPFRRSSMLQARPLLRHSLPCTPTTRTWGSRACTRSTRPTTHSGGVKVRHVSVFVV